MDNTRFDALTRSLATAANRRAFVRTAFAAVAAGIGGALGQSSALADACKGDGKLCKKHGQCCSGLCVPDPTANATLKSNSICCTPDARDVTCAGVYGPQVNNCEQVIDCPLGAGEPCTDDEQCASDHCCETCVDCSSVSETATSCGGCGNCCECFAGDSFGPAYCCDSANICGTYPNDICCNNGTVCVGGTCIKPDYACPHEIGGELVDCRFSNGAGCCNGVCCPVDKPVCLNGVCHAELPACSYPDNLACPDGSTCTANKWNPEGVCCINMGSWSPGEDDTGEAIIVNVCCGLNEKWGNDGSGGFCPTCIPKDHCGCQGPCTSRTSTPRIG